MNVPESNGRNGDAGNRMRPPAGLPYDPKAFWAVSADFESLGDAPAAPVPAVLERLGPAPFPKSGFPFMGFMATIYDHVATRTGGGAARRQPGSGSGGP